MIELMEFLKVAGNTYHLQKMIFMLDGHRFTYRQLQEETELSLCYVNTFKVLNNTLVIGVHYG